MKFRGIVPVFLLLVLATARADGETVLVRDGRPAAAVVLAERPTRSAQLAARELQEHVRLVTGAVLPIVAETAARPENAVPVYVGESEATRRMGLRSDGFRTQEYLVRAAAREIVLLGRDAPDYGTISYEANGAWPGIDIHSPAFEVGTLYAVYDFLERVAGVRWYLPTDLGTACERKTSLAAPAMEVRRAPWTTYRIAGTSWSRPGTYGRPDRMGYLRNNASIPARDNLLFALRSRQTGASFNFATHTLAYYNRTAAADHPDWFVDGKPGPDVQLRLWKDEVVERVAADIADWFGKPPDERTAGTPGFPIGRGDVASIAPLDNRNFGSDARPPLDPSRRPETASFGDGKASDYWFTFVNRVAERVGRRHPEKWIAALAYASNFEPPSFPLEPNVGVPVAMADGWEEESYGFRVLKSWKGKARRIFTYEYGYQPDFPRIRPRETADYIRRLKELGVEGLSMEMIGNSDIAPNHIDHYVRMKLLFDGGADVGALLEEYYRLFYGPAARPMKEFWSLMIDEGREIGKRRAGERKALSAVAIWNRAGERRTVERLSERLATAEKLAADEPWAGRVRMVRTGLIGMLEERVGEACRGFAAGKRLPCPVRGTPPPVAEGQPFVRAVGRPAAPATTVRAWRDGADLCVAFSCEEPRPEGMRTACSRHDDPSILRDDIVEIALDPGRTRRRYHHLVVNGAGTLLDEIVTAEMGTTWRDATQVRQTKRDPSWESNARIAVARRDGGWTVEARIPLASLTDTPVPFGEVWVANFARTRPQATDEWNDPRLTMWAPTFEAFNYPLRYGLLVMRPAAPPDEPVVAYDFEDDFPGKRFVADSTGGETSPALLRYDSRSGAPWTAESVAEGVRGRGIRFGGQTEKRHLQLIPSAKVNLRNDDFTLAFWYKTSTPAGYFAVSTTSTPSWGFYIGGDATNGAYPMFLLNASGVSAGAHFTGFTAAADGAWHHYVLMVDRAGLARLYVDGGPAGFGGIAQIGDLKSGLTIGGPYTHLDGVMDEFRVYQGVFDADFARRLAGKSGGRNR